MAEPQMRSSSYQVVSKVGTSVCPSVGDLINFALGHAAAADRQRVEAHLQAASCKQCRSWIDRAAGLRADGRSLEKYKASGPASLSPLSPSDSTPLPDNPKWQRQALDELERRLAMLEES
jgi:hypothetical protein